MEAYNRLVGGHRVDGMILARTRHPDSRITYLKEKQHPFVVNGRAAPGETSDFPYIDVDSQTGIRLLVEHFVQLNHRHIGLILPPQDLAYARYRFNGYREGLEHAKLPYCQEYVRYGDLTRLGGYVGAQTLLDQNPEITAIVACNDLMALGAMSAIQARRLKAGEDIAVAGFDDIPAAEYAHPPLTTIRQPIYEIGQRLVRMLVDLIKEQPLQETQVVLPPVLIPRASSGTPRR
jgi:DNA-binding LacI/PurR family transcriptional regulator